MGSKNAFFSKRFFCSKSFFIGSQMVWDPQKPKLNPVDPPVDPILAHFVGKKADLRGQTPSFFSKLFLLQNIFYRFPDGVGPSKTQNWPFIPSKRTPLGPILWAFWANLGSKKAFFSKIFFAPNHFLSVPRWPGTLKNPKLALYTP